MIRFEFTPWGLFRAFHDRAAVRSFVGRAGRIALKQLKQGLKNPPKTGRIYKRRGKLHQASKNSALAEFPAKDTGALLASAGLTVSADRFEIGTNMPYSRFLRDGTRKMERRKMSDTALEESMPEIRNNLRRWVYWKR